MKLELRGWRPVLLVSIPLLLFLALGLVACQPSPPTVTMALLGDLMLARDVTLDESSLAYLAAYLQSADLALANLESPLTTAQATSGTQDYPDDAYILCGSPENVDLLASAGLDILSLANNHRLDCGQQGHTDTRASLAAVGLIALEQDFEPVYQNIGGLQLAFLAFNDVSAPLDMAAANQAIHAAGLNADLVIVSIHWGMEYQGAANERQQALAAQFSAAGATLVWGHHPHVLQPVAWVGDDSCSESQAGPGCTLVLYSLGNALFDQPGLADTRRSALLLVELDATGVLSLQAVPFVIDLSTSRLVAPDSDTSEDILSRLHISQAPGTVLSSDCPCAPFVP